MMKLLYFAQFGREALEAVFAEDSMFGIAVFGDVALRAGFRDKDGEIWVDRATVITEEQLLSALERVGFRIGTHKDYEAVAEAHARYEYWGKKPSLRELFMRVRADTIRAFRVERHGYFMLLKTGGGFYAAYPPDVHPRAGELGCERARLLKPEDVFPEVSYISALGAAQVCAKQLGIEDYVVVMPPYAYTDRGFVMQGEVAETNKKLFRVWRLSRHKIVSKDETYYEGLRKLREVLAVGR